MSRAVLDAAFRAAGGRVIAALAAQFRDLDLAEEAFAEACVRAAARWGEPPPADPAAWLYQVARRAALDLLRRRAVRRAAPADALAPPPTPEDEVMTEARIIPDERLRLIFICAHPAVAIEARIGLVLRLVCGLSAAEIAAAFLTTETTIQQRLVRAKRKIAQAGVPFELPPREAWPERLDAVLSALELAYAAAYEDAAGLSRHAGFADEVMRLSGLLAELMPAEPEVLALAATVRYAEARRPARLDDLGAMVPLDEQDVRLWDAGMIAEAEGLLRRSAGLGGPPGPRALLAAIHGAHASRRRGGPAPWPAIVCLYDALRRSRPGPTTEVNRAVAVAHAEGAEAGLAALRAAGDVELLAGWLPWQAARAHLLAQAGQRAEALAALDAALALDPAPAERLYLERRRRSLAPA